MGSNEHTKSLVGVCPTCGYKIDAHDAVDKSGDAPQTGDISLCFKCTAINKYGNTMELITITQEEMNGMDPVMKAEVDKYVNRIKEHRKSLN